MYPRIKIYGERNCGTNYLENLIQSNIEVEILPGTTRLNIPYIPSEWLKDLYFALSFQKNLGWKHGLPVKKGEVRNTELNKVYFITILKSPYPFLLSLFRRPYHNRRRIVSFKEFLDSSWKTVARDRLGQPTLRSPMELWNQKARGYLELERTFPRQVIRLKYEELIADPEDGVGRIAEQTGHPQPHPFHNPTASTNIDEERSYSDYLEYYGKEKWREELDEETLELINEGIDQKIMEEWGYRFLTQGKDGPVRS